MNRLLLLTIYCLLLIFYCQNSSGQDKFLEILKEELNHHFTEMQQAEFPPYHMNFRVIDSKSTLIDVSYGAVTREEVFHSRLFTPQIRLGNEEFDNFKFYEMGSIPDPFGGDGMLVARLPIDDENYEDALRKNIWSEVVFRYKFAEQIYEQSLAQKNLLVQLDDKSPNYSQAPIEKYYEEPLSETESIIDMDYWRQTLKELTSLFKEEPDIRATTAVLKHNVERRYFVNTDGTEIIQNLRYATVFINGGIKMDDGMEITMHRNYFAYNPNSLPSKEKMKKDIEEMIGLLQELKEAPVAEPYSGPALLSGAASGVFFHEIFGHRIEGQRMKNAGDGQTFKKKIGEQVLPEHIQVYDDPTMDNYGGVELNGFYRYDEQGVKAQKVDVVINGKLNDFLMTRTPLDGHLQSNGHARASGGYDPVARQSNLIIETVAPKSQEELRKLLIEEIKKQGKEYGYYFKEVTSGFTFTGVGAINSFNVDPVLVYRVFADGRADQLVRGVEMIGTPLSMFSNIVHAGDDPIVFTGTCGAESGPIPVTAISPSILVSNIETQKKAKSQEIKPILPSPEIKK